MTIAVTFDASGSGYNDRIVLYAAAGATTPTAGMLNVYFKVTGPEGVVYKPLPSVPDFSFAALGNGTTTIPVPLDSLGNYIAGDYTIYCYVNDGAATPVVHYDDEQQFSFTPSITPTSRVSSRISLEVIQDCSQATLSAVGTQPESGTVDEESITVTPLDDVTDEEDSDNDSAFIYEFSFHNARYKVTYAVVATVEEVMSETWTNYWIESMIAEETVTTDCIDASICSMAACLEKAYKKLSPQICSGGWKSLSDKEKGRLMKATYIAALTNIFKDCANNTKVKEYKTKFEATIDCSCSCGDTAVSGPVPYHI